MHSYELLKTLHIIGATILFGTGAGIAFFMLMAHRTKNTAAIAHTARIVVIADFLFTAPAVILQPLTGAALARIDGIPLFHGWLALSLILYAVTGLFWLPVVWLQLRMRVLATRAVETNTTLPPTYGLLFRIWFFCGWPAFGAVLAIIWLMVAKQY
jgi:uncharacterized membrane protein